MSRRIPRKLIVIRGTWWKALLFYLLSPILAGWVLTDMIRTGDIFNVFDILCLALFLLLIPALGLFTIFHPAFRYDPQGAAAPATEGEVWQISDRGATHVLVSARSFSFDEVIRVWWLPGAPVKQDDWESYSERRLLIELRSGGTFIGFANGDAFLSGFRNGTLSPTSCFPSQQALEARHGLLRLTLQQLRWNRKRIRVLIWSEDGQSWRDEMQDI